MLSSSRKCRVISAVLLTLLLGELVSDTLAQVLSTVHQTQQEVLSKPSDDQLSTSQRPHHLVKRKSKGGRGFGFGRSKSRPKPSNSYPKQTAQNPNYGAAGPAGHGPPPAYPGGAGNKPAYPQQQYPGGYNAAPPAYPGGGHMPPPAYPGYNNMGGTNRNYGNGMGGGMGAGMGGMAGGMGGMAGGMGSGMGGGGMFGNSKGGMGRSLGSAGFGALAGTAVGAYGGYKLGKMIGGMGHSGHYGYYNDHGRYMRCEPPPPAAIRVDPVTNVTYIPQDAGYDMKCSYFERQPPMYYTSDVAELAPSFILFGLLLMFSLFIIRRH